MVNSTTRVQQLLELYGGDTVTVATLLCDRYAPDQLAYRIIGADAQATDYSYGELRAASEKFAAALQQLGVAPGDRVATLMGKSWDYLVALMGIWRLGAVHVPLFTAFAPPAIALRLNGSNARIVICDETQRSKLDPGDEIPANPPWKIICTGGATEGALSFERLMNSAEALQLAAVLNGDAPIIQIYTSGTTGNPKGVVVPVRALASFQIYAEYGQGITSDDLFWCAADPGWAYGLYFGVLSTFTTGVPSVLLSGGFDADVTIKILAGQGITNFAAAPTVYRALRNSGSNIPSNLALRKASSAGEPLTPEVNDWAEKVLGVTVHDHYGQTEAGMLINNHHHPEVASPIKAGSMGKVMPGWKGAVLKDEEDEIASSGELGRIVMDLRESPLAWFKGYEGNPEKSAEKLSADGRWFYSGDTGFVDEDGYFHFSSRDDDLILMAGYRIGPFEVESVMATHPAVVETAVIAVPDEVRGEVIEAYVVLNAENKATEELVKDIQNWVKKKYAAHAYPRQVHFVSEMPKTPSGKIQRFALKKQRLQELQA